MPTRKRAAASSRSDSPRLQSARLRDELEPFTLAMAQLAYERDAGPEVAYRIERFGK
jgi:hypothetical protein